MQTTKWLAGLTMAAGLAIAPAQAQVLAAGVPRTVASR